MNKLIAVVLIAAMSLTACADSRVVNGRVVAPYGIFEDEAKEPDVVYSVSGETIVWCVVCSWSLVIPLLLIGFSLWEPEGPKYERKPPTGPEGR